MNNTLQDINGNNSSKRMAGFIGLFMAAALSIMDVFMAESFMNLITAWLGFAGAALLGTLLERANSQEGS